MSHIQPRGERNESTLYRKTGRSVNPNQLSYLQGGASSKGGGGASSASSNAGNRSSKKFNSNAQGGHSRARIPNVESDFGGHAVQIGPNVISTSSSANLTDGPIQKNSMEPSSNAASAAPASNSPGANSESGHPRTPTKGDAAKPFPLQFGSISPGFMNNGVQLQIPPRTTSAPPNLDEQKKAQARQGVSRADPAIPLPSIPKQPLSKSRKDAGILDQTNIGQAPQVPRPRRDKQASAAPLVNQTQKPGMHPVPGMPMQLPFHQPQVPVQFGGPQIPSQVMPGTSLPLQMQMPMHMGGPMQQPMFIPGLQQHHHLQSQGMMHQGQNFHFAAQMGHQIPPQMGVMGITPQQFPQQQAGKYSGARKTVKITHPETHEELRLDGSPASRSLPNVPAQSQPIHSFPPNHPKNFYPNSYSANQVFAPPGNAPSKNSPQVLSTTISQPPRLHNQVTIRPPPIGSHGEKEQLPRSDSVERTESVGILRLQGEDFVHPQKIAEPSSSSSLPLSQTGLQTSSATVALSGSIIVESDATNTPVSASTLIGASASELMSSADEAGKGVVVSNSVEDTANKLSNTDQEDQVGRQSTMLSSSTSQLSDTESMKSKPYLSGSPLAPETANESVAITLASSQTSDLTSGDSLEGKAVDESRNMGTKDVNSRQCDSEIIGRQKQEDLVQSESLKSNEQCIESSLKCPSLTSSSETMHKIVSSNPLTSNVDGLLEQAEENPKKSLDLCRDNVKITTADREIGRNAESFVSMDQFSSQNHTTRGPDAILSVLGSVGSSETTVLKPDFLEQEPVSVLLPSDRDGAARTDYDHDTENNGSGLLSPSSSSEKDKVLTEANVAKTVTPRLRKKKKDLYRKADAAGATSDLYMAYKGPEEKKETVASAENIEKALDIGIKQPSAEVAQENHELQQAPTVTEVEPDDWEDAAEIASELETSKNENQGNDGGKTRRYSRDFLLKFMEQCTHPPEEFKISIPDQSIMSIVSISHDSYPSSGRNIERLPVGGFRQDRPSVGLGDDKWNKPGPFTPGRGDMWEDAGYVGNVIGLRPDQRNPRLQTPVNYAGGILPMQSPGYQGGLQRNNANSDRWQRGTGFQKGLMSSPQTPQMVMHKAEKKYEVGKVTDEEAAKQRQLKAILNKLTPQNFEKLFQQVKQVNIDNAAALTGVISQIFDKALMEPTFCEMYANFCSHLAADLPELNVDNEKITFKRLLLNKCQEEFERGEREEEEANKADEEGEIRQTKEEREEKRLQARRRMLGNIRLIGELYKMRMLTERIMHGCINKLLGEYQNPDEENIEALCKLMSTIGEMIDHPKAKDHMDAYFDIMTQLSNNMKLSSRVRFMLKDVIDLRKNKWQQRRKVEGPKKIEDVHRDAAQERQAQTNRLARAPGMGNNPRRGPTMDFAPRASTVLSSPGSHMGSFHTTPSQSRGHGFQDARMDESHSFENRTFSFPLPQRHHGDDSIKLGPQGGLMARGRPSTPSNHLPEVLNPADAQRMGHGPNGFSSMPERRAYGQRADDLMLRNMPDRFDIPSNYDQLHQQQTYGSRAVRNADRGSDRPVLSSPQGDNANSMHTVSSEKGWSEEVLQDKSMAAIKEFYSARDEKEIALCIKDLSAPSFYPSMISLWISDSFERKDMERDLLTKLLINLAKPKDGIISEDQLVKGFESVLAVLEDAVNDAPRAAEYLGRTFAKVILENTVSLSEIGQLIQQGGEEQGSLVESGLAAEVMGSVLDTIASEKGDSVLIDIRSRSNLQLEKFRPPGSNRSWRIDKFI